MVTGERIIGEDMMSEEIERAEHLQQILAGVRVNAGQLVDPKLMEQLAWMVDTLRVLDVPAMRAQLEAMIVRLDAIEESLEEAREDAALLLDGPPFLEGTIDDEPEGIG